jgi:hypothetical protein
MQTQNKPYARRFHVKHQRLFAVNTQAAALTAALALMLMQGSAQASVESGHWRVASQSTSNALGYNLSVLMDQTPDGDFTGTFLNHDANAGTLKFITYNTDEGSTLFITRPGQLINDDTLINLPPQDRLSFSANLAKVGSDFYLGGATEKYNDPGFQYNDQHWTVFGWVHLKVDTNGKLQVLDSAMSFNEGGIVAGSLAVPEASTWSMMALGLVGLGALRRQHRHATPR